MKLLIITFFLFSATTAFAEEIKFENKLMPFTSDGCSMAPNGFPVVNPQKWLHCCVAHDIAYWKGGTADDRIAADVNLGRCVESEGGSFIGGTYLLFVRLGGMDSLPLTWHWGYGWVMNRGYDPLSPEEQAQVDTLAKKIPSDLNRMPITSPGVLSQRSSITGNRCLDLAGMKVFNLIRRSFKITGLAQADQEKPNGFWKTLALKTDASDDPFVFTFQLLKRNACEVDTSELVARDRIRLINWKMPNLRLGDGLSTNF